MLNNPEKAAVMFNSKGKGENITVNDIRGENLISTYSEKLLGLHLNSDFVWNTHVEKISIELKKRIGLLKRIQKRIQKNKLIIIAEAKFNSKIKMMSVNQMTVYHILIEAYSIVKNSISKQNGHTGVK